MMLAMACSSVKAEWIEVDKNYGLAIYVNPATIFKNGTTVKIWEVRDFNFTQTDVEGNQYVSIMIQKNFDCERKRYRISNFSYHAENMGYGRVIYNSPKFRGWREVAKLSVVDVEKKIACGE